MKRILALGVAALCSMPAQAYTFDITYLGTASGTIFHPDIDTGGTYLNFTVPYSAVYTFDTADASVTYPLSYYEETYYGGASAGGGVFGEAVLSFPDRSFVVPGIYAGFVSSTNAYFLNATVCSDSIDCVYNRVILHLNDAPSHVTPFGTSFSYEMGTNSDDFSTGNFVFQLADGGNIGGTLTPQSVQISGAYVPGGPVSPAPEPGEWSFMVAGLAVTGWTVRRRRGHHTRP